MPYYPEIRRKRMARGPERLRSRRPLAAEAPVAGPVAGVVATPVASSVGVSEAVVNAAAAPVEKPAGRRLFQPKPKSVS